MLCPNGHGPMLQGSRLWICEQCDARLPFDATPAPAPLAGLDLLRLPYPVALTAQRLLQGLDAPDVLRPLFRLKDCFEAVVKFQGAVLLDAFRRSPAATTERKDELLKRLVRPSLGVWINQVVGDLSHALLDADAPASVIAGWFVQQGKGKKLQETPLRQQCRDFVTYRNDALGHGAERPERQYRQDLADWLPILGELLTRLADLADWRLCLVTDLDRAQVWMGPQPTTATVPGCFRREQIGRFVLGFLPSPPASGGEGLGVRGEHPPPLRDLYPFLCYLPDPQQEHRLHFYDSLYRYQPSRKEADVLEYDQGCRHPRAEPIAGLEEAFTADLLAGAFQWHRGRMAVIEGRVASFGELLETHAAIVGRRFAVERVRRFLAEHDRGLLVIEGEPGKGKTALLAHLIEEVFGQHVPRPVHFFYRRTAGITDPDVCVRSLYHALLQVHDIAEAEESKRQDSAELIYHKLVNLLVKEIAPRLAPGRPQLLFLDALDEADRVAFGRIPEDLPAGVYVITSTRPVTARTALARRANLHWFDLDDPDLRALNRADGFEYVQRELAGSDLPPAALDEIARLGDGNFLVLTLLCRHIRNQALTAGQVAGFLQRLATDGREDRLGFLYAEFWERLAARCSPAELNLLCDVAGVLVSAHAPLTAEVICGALGLRAGEWDFALRRLAEYLTVREDEEEGARETFYRIYHESFADFLRAKVAVDRTQLGNLLADYGLRWQELPEGYGRGYALRFGPRHLLEVGRTHEAAALLDDWRFPEAKTAAGLVFELASDFSTVAKALPAGDERRRLGLLEEALRRDVHFIHRHREDYPQGLFQCLWNSGWWYDCPEAAKHYYIPQPLWRRALLMVGIPVGRYDAATRATLPWLRPGPKLCELLERWRAVKEQQPGFVWLRSLRPPPVHLGTALKAVFRGHERGVNCVAYSPDGRLLASGSQDGTVRIWDAAGGAQLLCFHELESWVRGVAFFPDGRRIVGGSNHLVLVWDVSSGDQLLRLQVAGEDVIEQIRGGLRTIVISPDGQRIAGGLADGTVRVWDAINGAVLLCVHGHDDSVESVAFSPDGQRIASGSSHTVLVSDGSNGSELVSLRGDGGAESIAFSPDGQRIAFGYSRTVWACESVSGAKVLRLEGHKGDVYSVTSSRDSRCIATASYDLTVRIWDALTGTQLRCLKGHDASVQSVVFSPDDRHIASGSDDQTVRVWSTGSDLFHLQGHESWMTSMAFSPDGRRVATGSDDKTVRVWDAASGAELLCLRGHEWYVGSLAFSPDGRRIASGSDHTVRVWDAANGAELLCLRGHESLVCNVAFSPHGQQLAGGAEDNTVRVWNVDSGAELLHLQGQEGLMKNMVFSPDGKRIATGSEGLYRPKMVQVWDALSGQSLEVIHGEMQAWTAFTWTVRARWRMLLSNLETGPVPSDSEMPIAWFSTTLSCLVHPSRPIIAGALGNHVYLLALEGAPPIGEKS